VWFQFAATLTEAGVPYNKLNVVNIQGAGTSFLQAMQRGDIDVFIGWEPFESQAEQQGLGVRDEALVAGEIEEGLDADTSIGSGNGERSAALNWIVQQLD